MVARHQEEKQKNFSRFVYESSLSVESCCNICCRTRKQKQRMNEMEIGSENWAGSALAHVLATRDSQLPRCCVRKSHKNATVRMQQLRELKICFFFLKCMQRESECVFRKGFPFFLISRIILPSSAFVSCLHFPFILHNSLRCCYTHPYYPTHPSTQAYFAMLDKISFLVQVLKSFRHQKKSHSINLKQNTMLWVREKMQ